MTQEPGETTNQDGRRVATPLAEQAASTRKLYAGEWAGFVAWCRAQRRAFLPADGETLATFLLSSAAELSQGALGRRRAAVGAMHRQAGLAVPRMDAAARKALRDAARPPAERKAAPTAKAATLVRIAARCSRDLAGLRDRALLLLVAATGRGSGGDGVVPRLFLLALDAEDVGFTAAGAVLRLRPQAGAPAPGRTVTLARARAAEACPVRALEDWLRASDTVFGPVFRKVDRWGNVEHARLGADAWYRILARRSAAARPRSSPGRG